MLLGIIIGATIANSGDEPPGVPAAGYKEVVRVSLQKENQWFHREIGIVSLHFKTRTECWQAIGGEWKGIKISGNTSYGHVEIKSWGNYDKYTTDEGPGYTNPEALKLFTLLYEQNKND